MRQKKLTGLQVARAFAALGIAYFHSWRPFIGFPPGSASPIPILRDHGWIAVDFFFAISGFVICLVTASPRFDGVAFIIRRVFRLYPLWIATSFIYLYLTRFVGRDARQTSDFFAYSLSLLPTDGFPFYDLGWSLQHEMAFYLLATLMVPWLGLAGLALALAVGIAVDHLFVLPWYLHQYFSYYGNFLAGIAAFVTYRRAEKLGVVLPIVVGCIVLYYVEIRALFPLGLFCWLIGFLNMRSPSRIGEMLGDASYSIYLLHPLIFLYIYISLPDPLPPSWVQEPIRYGALIFICALAIGSWFLFERPFIWIGDVVARSVNDFLSWFSSQHRRRSSGSLDLIDAPVSRPPEY
jgi:peptidoglycan/LPS O-acetylase OafA/YrhL